MVKKGGEKGQRGGGGFFVVLGFYAKKVVNIS